MRSLLIIFVFVSLLSCNNRKDAYGGNRTSGESAVGNLKPGTQVTSIQNLKRFESVSKDNNSKANRNKLIKIAAEFYRQNDKLRYKEVWKMYLENAREAKDTIDLSKAYKTLGAFYLETAQNDSSYYYYIKAEDIALKLKDDEALGAIYLDIAFIKLYESDFTGSEISASKALIHLPKDGNKFNFYDAYNIIGVCSNELKNYGKALEYHKKALDFSTKNQLVSKFHVDANSMNNIGYVYQNMNKDKEAISYFKRALTNKSLFNDNPNLYAMLLDNLAYSKFKLHNLSQLASMYNRSLAIRDSLNTDPSGIVLSKIHLSQLYQYLNDKQKAILIATDALNFSKKNGAPLDVLSALKQISLVDTENSSKYSQEYIKINDSVQQIERSAKDKFARIQWETTELSQEKDKLEEQNRNLVYFFIGTFMIGVLLFVIRSQRARNRELLLKQAQQKANEDIYNLMIAQQNTIEESRIREKKRIAQELHDGVLGRLFGARLNLDSLNKMDTEEAVDKRNAYLTELKNIEQDIREISHDLNREKYVLINNFIAILNNLLEEQQLSFEPEVEVSIDEAIKWEELRNNLKINLYRIIQESLQNINKYAEARLIKIVIKKIEDDVLLTISDNGSGFDVSNKKKGIGLQNMVSRTHELNGTFDVRSKIGKGTTISVTFPIANKKSSDIYEKEIEDFSS
ncbi:MAG: tetratricopeptide repeat protein [Sphingobacteriales bacterium]|nr:MAG: tetratricopeptide repeat protein [Sphingobacteriales bacterium]